ncbi:zinc finger CCCH-type with G patch domain-containing protein [Xenopus tropicalis]|uniref:Zinc finger CCCH-type with G patch domain-containing protein n=1 Tax=Xenopus tropicalis TaxID=8364 RepID=ZGPAT_XENTR|nr:zinc finger CCCH-type with G patch domain-containing protein [Xenopus tropicalis]Q28H71.1 RecName: Full=Zinc finger CCCH-type with G patch domain-containing protein [Xenopus tropicalis]AAI71133.1 zinc finger, CCCH-type with G patch domain [Xenopus tropicalis]AAI71135.1 zinc finger, CCCH-type with G patch domain [Xenopus tropicalis]CAJ82152.1 zinc finger ccch type with g patch domain [Xenopus tropicalis]
MEEESLAAALHTYRAQLEQVELSLRAGTDPTQLEDLTQLRNDLQQLIELTESSLLSVRKCKLLSSLEGSASLPAPEEPAAISSQDEEYEAFRRAIGEEPQPPGAGDGASTGSKDSEEEEEEEDGSSGMKVKAPYYSTWGTLEYHNAMVVGSEQLEDGEAGVRVLYLYPTHKAMKPCPFFLDGKCRFDDSCRFSHGQVVALAELQPFAEADVASLAVGSPCLAQHSDGIWYPARITDIKSGFYTVKFDSLLLKESVLEADSIIPPLRGSDSSSSDDDDDDEEEDDAAEDSGYARVLGAGSAGSAHSSQFGGWEAHTRGIGSKLLARMGYEIGKGLGRNAEGRVEPIQAVLLPKGKSLDQCIEMQQRKKAGGKREHKAGKRRPRATGRGGGTKSARNVFDFLNEKLEGRPSGAQPGESRRAAERKGKELYNASKDSKRALSVQVAVTAQRIQQKQREIGHLQEALARNVGRDSVVSNQLELRLSGARRELVMLQQEEHSLQREQRKADTHKKMTEF